MKDKQTTFFWIIIGLLCVNLLVNNHSITLWDEDEAAYAGFAERMYQGGASFVNPEYKWSIIHRKAPLHFWTITSSYYVFGVNEFAVRFPGALAILLACLSMFFMGRTVFGESMARWAAIVLSTSIVLPIMGKVGLTDATLLFSQTVAVLALLNFVLDPKWKWLLLLWVGIAVGVLTKGPPILIVTGGLWLWLAVFHPQRKNLIKTHPWFFGLLAMLPFGWWCYLSYLENYAEWQANTLDLPFEEWWQTEIHGRKEHLLPFLWDWYVLRRVGGGVLGQTAPPGYHLGILSAAFLTWLPFVFAGIWHQFKQFFKKERSITTISLMGWLMFSWLFYELMASKLPSYSMGAQPAIALVIAQQLHLWKTEEVYPYRKLLLLGAGLYILIFSILVLGLPIAGYYFLGEIALWRTILFSVSLAAALIYLISKLKQSREQAVKAFAYVGAVLMLGLWLFIAPIAEQTPIKPFKEISEIAIELDKQFPSKGKSTTPIYILGPDLKQSKISLIFYLETSFKTCEEILWDKWVPLIKRFVSKEPMVLILGTVAEKPINTILKENGIKEGLSGVKTIRVDVWSLDDQLKSHPFVILTNQ
ncbi:MAG: glycosyltransferase family 39 protein [Aureispira sp.]|nr:glycosyltransferase family 39 protein [Aureispira sp.]